MPAWQCLQPEAPCQRLQIAAAPRKQSLLTWHIVCRAEIGANLKAGHRFAALQELQVLFPMLLQPVVASSRSMHKNSGMQRLRNWGNLSMTHDPLHHVQVWGRPSWAPSCSASWPRTWPFWPWTAMAGLLSQIKCSAILVEAACSSSESGLRNAALARAYARQATHATYKALTFSTAGLRHLRALCIHSGRCPAALQRQHQPRPTHRTRVGSAG